MRIVLDTNVLFAAVAARGLCEALLTAVLNAHTTVLSEHILAELRRHVAGKLHATPGQLDEVESFLRENAEIVVPAIVPEAACADPDDRPVLGTAVAGRADALVTGDRELLALGAYESVAILPPRALYERLRG